MSNSGLNPQEQIAQDNQKNVLSNFNPLNWFSGGGGGFSFGGIFQILIVGVIGWIAGRSEWLQGMLNNVSEGLGDKVHNGIAKMELWVKSLFGNGEEASKETQAEMFNIASYEDVKAHGADQLPPSIMKDKETFDTFKKTVLEANGGQLKNVDDALSANTLFALATKQPELLKNVLKDFTQPGSMSAENKVRAGMLFGSMSKIINSPMLDTLLNATNRKNTIALLYALSPEQSPEQVEKMIVANLGKDGKPSPMLRMGLNAALNDRAKQLGVVPSAETAAGQDAAAVGMNGPSADMMVKFGAEIMGEKNMPAMNNLKNALGDRFPEFAQVLASGDRNQLTLLCMKKENIDAVCKFAKVVDLRAVHPEYQEQLAILRDIGRDAQLKKSLSHVAEYQVTPDAVAGMFAPSSGAAPTASFILYKMMDPVVQNDIKTLGTANVANTLGGLAPAYKAFLTPQNFDILLKNMDAISKNKTKIQGTQVTTGANGKDVSSTVDLTPQILTALTEMAVSNSTASFELIEANHPGKIAEFFQNKINRDAFGNIIRGLRIEGRDGKMLATLRAHWGNIEDGLVEVMMDKESVARLPALLHKQEVDIGWFDDKLKENKRHLLALQRTMESVDYNDGGQLTPTATTAVASTKVSTPATSKKVHTI